MNSEYQTPPPIWTLMIILSGNVKYWYSETHLLFASNKHVFWRYCQHAKCKSVSASDLKDQYSIQETTEKFIRSGDQVNRVRTGLKST